MKSRNMMDEINKLCREYGKECLAELANYHGFTQEEAYEDLSQRVESMWRSEDESLYLIDLEGSQLVKTEDEHFISYIDDGEFKVWRVSESIFDKIFIERNMAIVSVDAEEVRYEIKASDEIIIEEPEQQRAKLISNLIEKGSAFGPMKDDREASSYRLQPGHSDDCEWIVFYEVHEDGIRTGCGRDCASAEKDSTFNEITEWENWNTEELVRISELGEG